MGWSNVTGSWMSIWVDGEYPIVIDIDGISIIENRRHMTKRRLAVLFSGRLNTDPAVYTNIMTHLVQGNEVDFFVSYSKSDQVWGQLESDPSEHASMVQRFLVMYQPKKHAENPEEYMDLSGYPKHPKTTPRRMLHMFQNRHQVSRLFQEYLTENPTIHYDIVVSTRCDIWYDEPVNLDECRRWTDQDLLVIPVGNDYQGINDQMALGNRDTVVTYLSLYPFLLDILNTGTVLLNPEIILKYYLEQRGVSVHRIGVEYHLVR